MHDSSGLVWPGLTGWAIAAFTAVFVGAGIYVAATRGPREVAVRLLVVCALPFVVGIVGAVAEFQRTSEVIETLKAPTPRDLSSNIAEGTSSILLGLAGTAFSGVAGLVALRRSNRDEEPPPLPD